MLIIKVVILIIVHSYNKILCNYMNSEIDYCFNYITDILLSVEKSSNPLLHKEKMYA